MNNTFHIPQQTNKPLVIIGAGDFAREVAWLVERINCARPEWTLLGFVDDSPNLQNQVVDGHPVLGTISWLLTQTEELWVICAIGTGCIRQRVTEQIALKPSLHPATLIDPSAVIGRDIRIGPGCIICAGTVLTVHVTLHSHVIVNLNCTIGHDAVIGKYCTINPGVNVSGKVQIGACSNIGTGAALRDEVKIGANCVIGMGSLVTKDIPSGVIAYGSPCQAVRKNVDGIVFRAHLEK